MPALNNASRAYEQLLTYLANFAHTAGDLGLVPLHENMNWYNNAGDAIGQLVEFLIGNTSAPAYKGSYTDEPVRALRYGPGTSGFTVETCAAACYNFT